MLMPVSNSKFERVVSNDAFGRLKYVNGNIIFMMKKKMYFITIHFITQRKCWLNPENHEV